MTQEEKSRDDLEWDRVFSKGAYCIGGGFMVGCGLSVLTSQTWPVLFSTGVGLGLACVNLESQLWNKGQKESVTFENPWLKVKEKSSEEKPVVRQDEEPGEKIGRRESARSMKIPRPHWRPTQEPVPPVQLDKDRKKAEESLRKKDRKEAEESLRKKDRKEAEESLRKKDRKEAEEPLRKKDRKEAEESLRKKDRKEAEESLGKKERKEADHPAKEPREEEYAGKEAHRRDFPQDEQPERETREKEPLREAKPCPRAQKKKAKSHKMEQEAKEEKNLEVESDPTLFVD